MKIRKYQSPVTIYPGFGTILLEMAIYKIGAFTVSANNFRLSRESM